MGVEAEGMLRVYRANQVTSASLKYPLSVVCVCCFVLLNRYLGIVTVCCFVLLVPGSIPYGMSIKTLLSCLSLPAEGTFPDYLVNCEGQKNEGPFEEIFSTEIEN